MNTKNKIEPPVIIGKTYIDVQKRVREFAINGYPVLFVGERGTGKEVFARLYMATNKRKGPKNTRNCAAISEHLLRSEIFGHVEGAFTDAKKPRKGIIISSKGGILFLDELGDASPEFQAAILRVVEYQTFSQYGSDKEEKYDVLIIAATNRPHLIRDDLKDRFNTIYIPPLQKVDIPELAKHFLEKSLKQDYIDQLNEREYLGNVRELKRACEALKVKHGNKILNNKAKTRKMFSTPFNYERYCEEIEIWDTYILPLIAKYEIPFLKYKYTPEEPDYYKDVSERKEIIDETIKETKALLLCQKQEVDLLNYVNKMREHIRKNELPLLLNFFLEYGFEADNDDFIKEKSLRYAEKLKNGNQAPPMSYPEIECLLKIQNQKDAIRRFKKIHVDYHLRKNDNNKDKTAIEIDISITTLRRILDSQ